MPDAKRAEPTPSLEEIFEREVAYVARVLRYFGIPDADLKDVCQEVFVVVHRKLPEFEHRSALRTWLFRISQRTASDYRKKAHVRREVPVAEPHRGSSEAAEDETARSDLRKQLLSLLSQLDDDKRDVFVLFEIEGLTMKEVAEIMGCPLQTAYSRLHAARSLLKEAFLAAERGVA